MDNDIKPRTVYLLRRSDRPDNGDDRYVGSTSMKIMERLWCHRNGARDLTKYKNTKVYTRMREIGVNNWVIIPLLTFSCDKKTILEFEREWCNLLNANLNMKLAINTEEEKKEHKSRAYAKYYASTKGKIIQRGAEYQKLNKHNKVFHCNVCEKSFGSGWLLRRHFGSLKHQYTYLNSLD